VTIATEQDYQAHPDLCRECGATGLKLVRQPSGYGLLITCPGCAGTCWNVKSEVDATVYSRPASRLRKSRICRSEWRSISSCELAELKG
jgi:hypothetical protein